MEQDLANGLTLGPGFTGCCMGSINLPDVGIWTINLTILRNDKNSDDGVEKVPLRVSGASVGSRKEEAAGSRASLSGKEIPDSRCEGDSITVRLGVDISSMVLVGTYFNKVNEDTGTVLYDVKHVVQGKSLAYKFDFSCVSPLPMHRLVIETGEGGCSLMQICLYMYAYI